VNGPAAAGALLIAAILLGAGIGLGVGALVGAPAPLALVGGAIGVAGGFRLVYRRYRDI
jgi:hypothetical protein